ncbi:AAA domain-containing protein, partial [Candidatus Parcubacteria bacterium]|nr:AAA domain-containing protein [Candidatus Parcubacteria bacterium]
FKNTVIIMTSNVGQQFIDKMQTIGFSKSEEDGEDYMNIKDKVMNSLKDHFRPEFLNRVDDIIIFDVLSREAIKNIVNIQIDIVKKRLSGKEIDVSVTDAVLDLLSKEGYNPQYGARPLKRLIQDKILNPVASMMISNKVLSGGTILVDVRDGKFTFDIKKSRRSGTVSTVTSKESVLR